MCPTVDLATLSPSNSQALQWQGEQALDAILNYPMYNALVQAFTIPGPQNMSAVTDMIAQIKQKSSVRRSIPLQAPRGSEAVL